MRQDDLLHVVSHEEIVESSTLVPLHEGLLGPGRTTASERHHDCHEGVCGQCMPGLCLCWVSALVCSIQISREKPESPLKMALPETSRARKAQLAVGKGLLGIFSNCLNK